MIELHGARTGNCLRVSIALEEARLPYRVHRVDLHHGEHLRPEHLALNPEGKVPTIVEINEQGKPFVLSQSNAILFHLAERAPGMLLPFSAVSRALALQRFFYVLTDVIGPNHAAFRLRMSGGSADGTPLVQYSAAMMAGAERFLDSSPFIAGDAFGLADIAAVTTLSTVLTEPELAGLPLLSRWYRKAISRPSVERGMRAFDHDLQPA